LFVLSELLDYDRFTIQCHDNPDADAIASAFALHAYLVWRRKTARIVYAGKLCITKSNLLEMILKLRVPIEYTRQTAAETLVVVDGQYGAGNVTKLDAETVIVLDHHREERTGFDLGIVNPQLGSCSTLIWDLMKRENFPFENFPHVSTALFYGLFSDTGNLSEIFHPLDKDLRDNLSYDKAVIKRLQNTNLSIDELNIAGLALTQYISNRDLRYAIFKSDPCDPNILGFISDLALQVDSIDACVVYNLTETGAKLSVRSCAKEIMASELADFLTSGVGSGGGHRDKAGGVIEKRGTDSLGYDIGAYVEAKTLAYFSSYDIIDANTHELNVEAMQPYRKKNIPVGYVLTTDIFGAGTPLLVRTLEGDAECVASDDIFLIVGIFGEVYPIKAEKFNANYQEVSDAPRGEYSYSPTVKDKASGDIKELADYIKPCVATGKAHIRAVPLSRNTKVFTEWNAEEYMSGKPGDYLAVRSDDYRDVYIVREDIFRITYEML
jgi:phosphoglycolate phosphatase